MCKTKSRDNNKRKPHKFLKLNSFCVKLNSEFKNGLMRFLHNEHCKQII